MVSLARVPGQLTAVVRDRPETLHRRRQQQTLTLDTPYNNNVELQTFGHVPITPSCRAYYLANTGKVHQETEGLPAAVQKACEGGTSTSGQLYLPTERRHPNSKHTPKNQHPATEQQANRRSRLMRLIAQLQDYPLREVRAYRGYVRPQHVPRDGLRLGHQRRQADRKRRVPHH